MGLRTERRCRAPAASQRLRIDICVRRAQLSFEQEALALLGNEKGMESVAKSPNKPAKPAIAAKSKPAAVKPAKKPPTANAAVEPAAAKALAKSAKAAVLKAKASVPKKASPKSVLKETSQKISRLASDILADRIVPTIEQIKALAASALGQHETKGTRSKDKKK